MFVQFQPDAADPYRSSGVRRGFDGEEHYDA